MIWNIVVFSILAIVFIVGVIAFILKIGPYRQLDTKKRRVLQLISLFSALVMIYLAINLARMLLS